MITETDTELKTLQQNVCAFCASESLCEVIDFGEVAIAGAFLKQSDFVNEKKYPLAIDFCENCYAVQVRDHIDPKTLFSNDYYFSSAIKTLRDHFKDYATEVTSRYLPDPKNALVIEFGSNDGVLLEPLSSEGIGTVIGVDPAKNIIDSINDHRLVLINDFFNTRVAETITGKYGMADLVMANNVYAHITDINGTTEAVHDVLADNGVFIFEVHYLGNIIQGMQYDFIYHEHIYYYSLLALENHLARHGMVIFDLQPISIHGGSIRFHACKKTASYAKSISSNVESLRKKEKELGFDKVEMYRKFASDVESKKTELMTLLSELRYDSKTIIGYGASGRANTMIQYCGITGKEIDFMVDDAPAKLGLYTPGSHLEIKSSAALDDYKPDYVLLFAWAFYEEIVKKSKNYIENGGRIIIPLPDVSITPS